MINMGEKANREYNDSVFRMLFNEKSKSVELYNAINGTNHAADAVKMNMLDDVLFFGNLRNDISFTLDGRWVVLMEHQSTVNPNMPMRCLLYIADIYERLIDMDCLYKAKQMSIETPVFYVMYNGTAKFPEKSVLKLSDLFRVKDGEPSLELTVTLYNVNAGYNPNLMNNSKTLGEYAAFIAKVREYAKGGSKSTEALQRAVEYCVRNGILSEFLRRNGGEVMRLLQREWNIDDAKRVWKEEAREDMAEKMLSENEPIAKIVRYTELTEEKVIELKKNLKT